MDFAFGWAMQAPAFLERLDCPAKAIGSDPTVLHSYMPSLDLRDLVKLDYDFIPDVTHFLQLEVPETCAALTIEVFGETGPRVRPPSNLLRGVDPVVSQAQLPYIGAD